ncbi:hypothetical protein ACJIZ3_013616 [Penstemon smallii]|uniref:Uncharacterized protein n=1 Tax=Penstemon smallii TaxID=265156 RepID=A0ABD3RHM1_9LAMI
MIRSPSSMLLLCSMRHRLALPKVLSPFTRSNYQQDDYALLSTLPSSRNRLGVEIISVENIKPGSPTPHHLKTYQVSMLDQFVASGMYMSFVYFYSNKDENIGSNLDDLISKRRQILKHSLAETLTRFYPLAGKLEGERFIDCNDDGAYYLEAKVSDRLSDFLNHPDKKSIHQLLPFVPNSMELMSKTNVVMIQTTIFGCGGISIGLHTSHKIIDGYSLATFLNAWAATARGSDDTICPSFISPSIFPPNPTLDSNTLANIFALCPKQLGKVVTRRFVFSASSLLTLKEKAAAPSRVVAVTGLIWKCIMAAASSRVRSCSNPSSALFVPVNIRARILPPFPPNSIGNVFLLTCTRFKYDDDDDDPVGLNSIVGIIKNTTDKVNSEFTEKFKGEEGFPKMVEYLNEMKLICSGKNVEQVLITSMCNSGIYDIDFGWGKPIWASVGDAHAGEVTSMGMVYLMDTRSGNGIEAWVTLVERDMAVLERDVELLAFASLNPSPLL